MNIIGFLNCINLRMISISNHVHNCLEVSNTLVHWINLFFIFHINIAQYILAENNQCLQQRDRALTEQTRLKYN